jgi:hypothetical protein
MSLTNKRRAGLALAALAAIVPLGVTPAQATTLHDGCLVTPRPAEFRGTYNAQNVPYVYYPVDVVCLPSPNGPSASISIQVRTETWEQDLVGRNGDVDADGVRNADEDRIGSATWTLNFGGLGGGDTIDFRGTLPRTDIDNNDEVYQSVTFQVSTGLVTGSWSTPELTAPTRIWW